MIKIVSKKKWDNRIAKIEMDLMWVKSKIKVNKEYMKEDTKYFTEYQREVHNKTLIEIKAQQPLLEEHLTFLESELEWFKS